MMFMESKRVCIVEYIRPYSRRFREFGRCFSDFLSTCADASVNYTTKVY